MNYKQFTTILKTQTSTQAYEGLLEFAISVCKKLYFDYRKFTEVWEWGNADLLMDAIIICQKVTNSNGNFSTIEIQALLPKIESIIPDTNDYGDYFATYALNASAAVYETLEFIIDKDKIHIYNIATYYTDNVDCKIQEERDLTELEIENHPEMIDAWNFVIEQTRDKKLKYFFHFLTDLRRFVSLSKNK